MNKCKTLEEEQYYREMEEQEERLREEQYYREMEEQEERLREGRK